ncbi:uncharacterized protein L203_105300 [Cryptococcus depauperatus CBS 7841]|uniref:Inhibitor I9 domain-containing protein n=1 Tax=Cryptococcus depauperatus CBS 7841 TaxID=1295531 RepID=A0AAJ8JX63_9TREE
MQFSTRSLCLLFSLVAVTFLAAAFFTFPTYSKQLVTMSEQNVIVQFKKGSSVEDKQKAIQELKSKGAEVVKDDNINSPLMPFVVVTFSGDFSALESHFGSGSHEIVQNIEPDGIMHTQSFEYM